MSKKLVLKGAFNKSQDSKNTVGIWRYQMRTGIIKYSKKAKGHLDRKYFSDFLDLVKVDQSIIRGRLIEFDEAVYLVVFVDKKIVQSVLFDLKHKIETKSKRKVDFVVNAKGYLLLEKKQALSR